MGRIVVPKLKLNKKNKADLAVRYVLHVYVCIPAPCFVYICVCICTGFSRCSYELLPPSVVVSPLVGKQFSTDKSRLACELLHPSVSEVFRINFELFDVLVATPQYKNSVERCNNEV